MDLATFDNCWYKPGNKIKILLWMIISSIFFRHSLSLGNQFKIILLRIFGAKIGERVLFKQSICIKYPWNLSIGNDVWIGEDVWIDNLAYITIGNNVCISQGAFLLTGNHDYKKNSFDLIVNPITIEDEVWIGAKTIVCPGVVCKYRSILTVGSIATKQLDAGYIYQGNPALSVRVRTK